LSLRSVGDKVEITNNPRLDDLQMPSVGSIDGSLEISGNNGVRNAGFNTLNYVGEGLVCNDNSDLPKIEFPNLRVTGGSVDINNNAKMEQVNMWGIQEVEGDVKINQNAGLESITMSNLQQVDGDINLDMNPELKSVSLGAIKVRPTQKCSICTMGPDGEMEPNVLSTFIPWDAVDACTTECPGGFLTATSTEPTCWETNVKCAEKCRAVGLDVFRSECYGADDNRCLICSCLKDDGLGGNVDFTRFMPLDCTSPYCGYAEQGQSNACPVAEATQ